MNTYRRLISSVILGSFSLFTIHPLLASAATVPNNKVGIAMDGFVLTGTYSLVSGQPTGEGQFKNGNAGEYPEGSCIPSLVQVTNNDTVAGDIILNAVYDYTKDGSTPVGITQLESVTTALVGNPKASADNLNDLTFPKTELTSTTSFNSSAGSVSTAITGPYSGNDMGTTAITSTDTQRHYNITLQNVTAGATVYVLSCARMGVDSSQFPGSSLSVTASTGFGGGGNMPIQGSALIELPNLTVTKVVSGGTATPDQWSFNVSPAVNGSSTLIIPSGQNSVTINNVQPDGNYVITENPGPADYVFTSGSGTFCTFNGSTATAALATTKPTVNAVCTFTNTYAPVPKATLTVTKVVINDGGGTKTVSDFPLFVGQTSVSSSVPQTFSPATYQISETNSNGYVGTFSGDCDANGSITLADGDNKTCTLTNDDIFVVTTGTLMIYKTVINNDLGTSTASDFTLDVSATNPSQSSVVGNASGTAVTVSAGAYAVTEASSTAYTASFSADCSGTIAAAETKTCIVTNNDVTPPPPPEATTGTLIVIKNVVNDNNGTSTPSEFTFSVTGTNPTVTSFAGSSTGTSITLDPGSYAVTEASSTGYNAAYSADCTGTIVAGETKTCTVTNDDIAPPTTGTIMVIVNVVNNNSGSSTSSDFTVNFSGTNASTSTFSGNASGTAVVVDAGSYVVSQSTSTGYTTSFSADCLGTIVGGATKTCTITNDDLAPTTGTLIVRKVVVNDNGKTATSGDFTLNVTGNSPSSSSVQGSEIGVAITVGAGNYSVSEPTNSNYTASYSTDCSGSMVAGQTKTCTVTNNDNAPVSTGGGGGGGGGGGMGDLNKIITLVPSGLSAPAPRVLGESDVNEDACNLTEPEAAYITPEAQTILDHLKISRNLNLEDTFRRILMPRIMPVTASSTQWSLTGNFTYYGTRTNVRLGQGERAGVVDSYQAVYGRQPVTDCEWQNAVKIANTKVPLIRNNSREKASEITFQRIYKRAPNRLKKEDSIALDIMTYGVRPQIRDLDAERAAIVVFKKVFGKLPSNATEWDANRALAYSGVYHPSLKLSKKSLASRMTVINTSKKR
jgi:hypothetical protein